MAALMRARASPAAFRVLAAASRTYGTSLPVPTPPPGSEMVFHSRNQQPKYSLS
eukprot:CAMPEP_0175225444 /NCGR_PEP_ID=MMETSP0093-20121207/22379_1 /TAXON_ID=311494 /ORGANISM="Alexandrium monilatum, Strain CCMP3105" /LENGTH=53 /DNA_ID=CAMNT_0016519135 /DNA_START=72 /DNA_END=229 /DNA_ORIENTATION=-